jgi:hypothetical protein
MHTPVPPINDRHTIALRCIGDYTTVSREGRLMIVISGFPVAGRVPECA